MLGDTVMDVLARRQRARGVPTLWLPGTDHAGLSTQVEVRRRLQKEGVAFEGLSREEAVARVQAWKEEHEPKILEQIRAGGFSVDWSRYRYTLDPASARATRAAFVALFDAGLLYRGERMVNWDPRLETAVSDLEVVHREEETELLYVRYAWADGAPGGLEVATVRPETIFGDVAVAVHPDDVRYRGAVGRAVVVPLVARAVPVVADPAVDPTFGAGALKITPRHDPVDREIFLRHPGLAEPAEIFDTRARLTGDGVPPEFRGLSREEARRRTAERLASEGLLVRRERHRHSIARSERSDAVIEPRLSTQWFVRMRPLAEPVEVAVRRGTIRIRPERWLRTFFRWIDELQDWCVSRQIVWGHPIPVDYCKACGRAIASLERPTECPSCHGRELVPDPDVLDTWFTSWLWPFAALGWPEPTSDLAGYYPTSVLVTGRDIMFFWVARMMMAGYRFTGTAPFTDVYLTGMVRDAQGRRMSKHLGNSPDPLAVIRERGADPLRFALVFPNPTDEDGPFGTASLDGGRNFLTKLWNLVRFALGNLPEGMPAPRAPPALGPSSRLENRWILARYHRTLRAVDEALDAFEVTRAATELHGFVWHDLADRFVEIAKDALAGRQGEPSRREAEATLGFVLERTLRLLAPFVPHVTEELWHALPHDGELLATAPWPSPTELAPDLSAEVEIAPVLEAIRLFRNLRAEEEVPPEATPRAWIRPGAAEGSRRVGAETATIVRLAHLGRLDLLAADDPAPPGAASRVAPTGECYLERPPASPRKVDTLSRERERLATLLEKARNRLGDDGFRNRAPPEVVEEAEAKARELEERIGKIDRHLEEAARA
jgi:valyl-tRNA synthetase